MQTRIEAADAGSAALLVDRLTATVGASPMLGICTASGCSTIVFGRGACVAHDPLRVLPRDSVLEDGLVPIER